MSRRYYYDVNDWVQFEEIEDLEERGQLTVMLALFCMNGGSWSNISIEFDK